MGKITREKFKTYGNVFDEFTIRNLFKLSSQGYFEEPLSQVALGKEANVFSAERADGKRVIIKIYRLENCDFNQMYNYLRLDDRFQNIKKNKRKIIFIWTQKEFRNLMKARESGINVPTPYHFMFNIIIEEFIGDESPSPKLKDIDLEDPKGCFDEIISQMVKLWKGGLVHGDLSPFNILYWNEKPYFIDMGQGTDANSTNARELLERDLKNVCDFFERKKVKIDMEKIRKKFK